MTVHTFITKFPDVEEINTNSLVDLACPKCGDRAAFYIQVTAGALVCDMGVDETQDPEWDDDSYCRCRNCGHHATIEKFTINGLDSFLSCDLPREAKALLDSDPPKGACILTPENLHTADDCTLHDHEP